MIFDLIAAVILDWIIGDPYSFPHPVIYIGKLINFLKKKKQNINSNYKVKIYGLFIVIVVCTISFIIPFIILKLLQPFKIIHHIVNILILWTTIAAKCLHVEGKKIYYELKKGDIKEARVKLSYIVGRDTKNLSEDEIIRADVETIAENTSDGIIAPLFYACIGGAPLAMLYKAVNTMDSMLGYMNEEYIHIGFFPAKIDDIFNYVPARISGILIAITSPFVTFKISSIKNSLKIMIRDRKNHKSPNCAYPEGAVSGALNIQLGGTNVYFGEIVEKPTIGDFINKLNYEHINLTIKLMYSSEILFVIIYLIIKMLIK